MVTKPTYRRDETRWGGLMETVGNGPFMHQCPGKAKILDSGKAAWLSL